MRDLKNNIDEVTSIAPAAHAASVNGTGVDLKGFDGAVVSFVVGAITDGTHTPTVEESDDNITYTAVAAADLEGTLVDLTANTNQRVGYKGSKRYIRPVSTVAGATTGGVYAATVIRGIAHMRPVA